MKTIVTVAGITLLLFWALSFFMLGFSGSIHAVLILSAILFLRGAMICPAKNMVTEQKNNICG